MPTAAEYDITEALGMVSAASGVTTTNLPPGIRWDCSIAGMPFLFAMSDQFPMQRETAEFRRQRIDNERDPGEQSLDSGFWLRSQSSFHLGAGLTSAEPLEINDAEARFRYVTSGGVDVWTPGELRLLHASTVANADSTASQLAIGVDTGVLHGYGTTLKYVPLSGSSSTVTWSGTHTITSLTTDGSSYFVGDETGIWKGTLPGSSGTGTRIYSLSAAPLLRWVKQRLMTAVGESIYEVTNVSPATPPAALPTAHYVHPTTGWKWTDFAEGPSAIYACGYAGDTSMIYRMTVTASGTGSSGTIGLSQPTVVAELPRGEVALSLYSYLGSLLIIGTSKGLRVASIAETTGALNVGPLLFTATGGVKDTVAIGSYIYAAAGSAVDCGNHVSRPGLWRVDLATPLDNNNRFACAPDLTAPSGTSGAAEQVTVAGGKVFFTVSGAGLLKESTDFVSEGWLETGRIRFATLERKAWRDLRLIGSAGMSGTVEGYVSSVGDTSPSFWSKVITISGAYPDEAGSLNTVSELPTANAFVALRLVRDISTPEESPVLGGYQLRALPAPRRSELVQVPILVFDFMLDRNGLKFGWKGAAWDMVSNLKAMESAKGTVQWRDFTTGEVAEGYVEQIRFTRTTPPTRNLSGMGGIATVTLRLV